MKITHPSPKFSVIVTAYQAQDFIAESINSIVRQIPKPYQVLIGFDDCMDSLNALKPIGRLDVERYMFPKVGTYVIRNTLATMARGEWLIFFDSDDIMKDGFIRKLSNFTDYDVIRYKFVTFYGKDKRRQSLSLDMVAKGSFAIRKDVFMAYNGFLDWQCTADAEFMERTASYVSTKELEERIFLRRAHTKQLTKSLDWGMQTEARHALIARIYDNVTTPILPQLKTSECYRVR